MLQGQVEPWPLRTSAGSRVRKVLLTPRTLQGVGLKIEVLLGRGDAGIADQQVSLLLGGQIVPKLGPYFKDVEP